MVKFAEVMHRFVHTRTTYTSLKNSRGLLWEIDGKKFYAFYDTDPIPTDYAFSQRMTKLHHLIFLKDEKIFYGDW